MMMLHANVHISTHISTRTVDIGHQLQCLAIIVSGAVCFSQIFAIANLSQIYDQLQYYR